MKNIFNLFRSFGAIVAITCLFFVNPAKSDTTYVSGVIASANWNTAGSPYVVTNNVLVAGLTIDPGVSVLFAGNYEFEVQGVIEAIGNEQSPITFTTKTGVSSWKGILFQNSNPGSFMKWCVVEKANTSGIRIIGSFPSIRNSTIRNNQSSNSGGGILISNASNSDLDLIDCIISNNTIATVSGGGGVRTITNGTVRFIRCRFENNSASISNTNIRGGAINIGGKAEFLNCIIQGNSVFANANGSFTNVSSYGGGVFIDSGSVIFKNCTLKSNRAEGTRFFGDASHAYGGGIFNEGNLKIYNSIITYDEASATNTSRGGGIYNSGGQIYIENSTLAYNYREGIWNGGGNIRIINSICYFNYNLGSNNYGPQLEGTFTVTYSDVQQSTGVYPGVGNINASPILNSCFQIVSGSQCIDAGNDSVQYRDACFPPSEGGIRNDMGADGGPGACNWSGECYSPVLPIKLELTALMEGLYNSMPDLMVRPQVERMYLRNATCPYAIVEPAASTLGQNGISTPEFIFNSSSSGTYYLVIENWNNLETWSKAGGELLYNDGETNYYDFTTDACQAYGCNQKLIGSRWCTFTGDVTQNGSIDLADMIQINGSSNAFTTGYNVNDLNGDNQVNLTDLLMAYNNSAAFVAVKKPICPP